MAPVHSDAVEEGYCRLPLPGRRAIVCRMRMVVFLCGLLVFVVALSSSAQALVPPMSEEELEREADLIVEVRVVKVDVAGGSYDDSCYTWQDHIATLAISKVFKGDGQLKEVTVRYGSMVENNADCDGGRTPYSMAPDERYKLHLRQVKGSRYGFINWAGVERRDGRPPPPSAEPPTSAAPSEPKPPTVPSAPASPLPTTAPKTRGACACGLGLPRRGNTVFGVVALALLGLLYRRCRA